MDNNKPATLGVIQRVLKRLNDAIEQRFTTTDHRIAYLESRLQDAETRLCYRGVWRDGMSFKRGNFATDHGSLWHCNTDDTKQRPGNGSQDWQLAAKGAQK